MRAGTNLAPERSDALKGWVELNFKWNREGPKAI
jgi:hypothetical protein